MTVTNYLIQHNRETLIPTRTAPFFASFLLNADFDTLEREFPVPSMRCYNQGKDHVQYSKDLAFLLLLISKAIHIIKHFWFQFVLLCNYSVMIRLISV